MKRIHIVGRKNSGKTTLIVDLVHRLTTQGLVVGTIKHTHHHHELDTPGKDSFRHREAGARAVGILSPKMNAIFWPQDPDVQNGEHESRQDKYDRFQVQMQDCDIVLVEGDSSTQATKIEVWRAENETEPILASDDSVSAMVTDDPVECSVQVFSRQPIDALVQWIVNRAALANE